MTKKFSEKCFSIVKTVFFDVLSTKFRPGLFKRSLNFSYVIFEKVAYNFKILSESYIEMYEEIVKKEIELANISPKESILVIGAGSIPGTSIQIAKTLESKVVSIDIDKKAILRARKFVRNLNLSNKIQLEIADGRRYNFDKFDIIFILYGVKQNIELLKIISEKMNKESKVIFRSVFDKEQNTIKSDFELSKLFVVKDIIKSEKIPPVASALLLKRNI